MNTRQRKPEPKPQSLLQKLHSQFNWLMHFRLHKLPYGAGIRDAYLSPRFLRELDIYNKQTARLKLLAEIELLRNKRSAYIMYARNSFTSEEAYKYRAKAEECRVQLEERVYKELDKLPRYTSTRD